MVVGTVVGKIPATVVGIVRKPGFTFKLYVKNVIMIMKVRMNRTPRQLRQNRRPINEMQSCPRVLTGF